MPETEISRAEAKVIFDHDMGCRYGTTTEGAAYAFMDIVGGVEDGHDPIPPTEVILRWLRNPEAPEFEPRWDNRLWNTCGVIVSLMPAGTVLLVSKAAPTAERYRFGSTLSRGDGYSFRKCNRLPQDSQILATIQYGESRVATLPETLGPPPTVLGVSEEQVKELFAKIKAELAKLAST